MFILLTIVIGALGLFYLRLRHARKKQQQTDAQQRTAA